jgi:hypothetical protein
MKKVMTIAFALSALFEGPRGGKLSVVHHRKHQSG